MVSMYASSVTIGALDVVVDEDVDEELELDDELVIVLEVEVELAVDVGVDVEVRVLLDVTVKLEITVVVKVEVLVTVKVELSVTVTIEVTVGRVEVEVGLTVTVSGTSSVLLDCACAHVAKASAVQVNNRMLFVLSSKRVTKTKIPPSTAQYLNEKTQPVKVYISRSMNRICMIPLPL